MMLEEIPEAEVVNTTDITVEADDAPAEVISVEQQKKELEEAGVKTLGITKDINGNEAVLIDPASPNISTMGAGSDQDTLPIPARIKQLMKYEKIPRYAMTAEQKQILADWRAGQTNRVAVTTDYIESATPFTPAASPAKPAGKKAAKKKRKTTKKKS